MPVLIHKEQCFASLHPMTRCNYQSDNSLHLELDCVERSVIKCQHYHGRLDQPNKATSLSLNDLFLRLSGGPSQYVGTIEYSHDGGITWQTVCGNHIGLEEVQVICRQLGFKDANRVIKNSPFKSEQNNATSFFTCEQGTDVCLDNCTIHSPCYSVSQQLGGAACYDERYLGCFRDNVNGVRVLPYSQLISNDMTIEKCVQFCKSNTEYVYAGVLNSNECYCGDASSDYAGQGPLEATGCLFTCAGDTYSSCGGSGGIAVFNLTADPSRPPYPIYSPCHVTTPRMSSPSSANTFQPTSLFEVTDVSSDSPDINGTTTFVDFTAASTSSPPPVNNTALYAGVGVGVAVIVVFIIMTVLYAVFIQRKRKSGVPSNQSTDHQSKSMDAKNGRVEQEHIYMPNIKSDDNSTKQVYMSMFDRPAHEKGESCYVNSAAETEHEYQSVTEHDKREYVNFQI